MSAGTVYPNVETNTRYLFNGVPVENYANILGADEGYLRPGDQPDNVVKVPRRHGVINVGGTVGPGGFTLAGYILGVDPDTGQWASNDSYSTYKRRVDDLMRMFTHPLPLVTAVRPDGTSRQAYMTMIGGFAPTEQAGDPWFGRFKVSFRIPGAFWEDSAAVTQLVSGTTGTVVPLDAFAGANAPCSDLVITTQTAVNNPLLVHGDRTLQFNQAIPAGRQVVINTSNFTVSAGTGAAWSPTIQQVAVNKAGPWFELVPSISPFAVTFVHTGGGSASLTITGRRKYYNP